MAKYPEYPEGEYMTVPSPVYPNVTVELSGMDGNAFNMIGRTGMEMRRAGVANVDIVAFREEAMSGNYDHVLQTIMKYVNVR